MNRTAAAESLMSFHARFKLSECFKGKMKL